MFNFFILNIFLINKSFFLLISSNSVSLKSETYNLIPYYNYKGNL